MILLRYGWSLSTADDEALINGDYADRSEYLAEMGVLQRVIDRDTQSDCMVMTYKLTVIGRYMQAELRAWDKAGRP